MAKWKMTLEVEFDRPPANAEEERRLCVVLEMLGDRDVFSECAAGSDFHLTPRSVIAYPTPSFLP
jgi:hypothetical protein